MSAVIRGLRIYHLRACFDSCRFWTVFPPQCTQYFQLNERKQAFQAIEANNIISSVIFKEFYRYFSQDISSFKTNTIFSIFILTSGLYYYTFSNKFLIFKTYTGEFESAVSGEVTKHSNFSFFFCLLLVPTPWHIFLFSNSLQPSSTHPTMFTERSAILWYFSVYSEALPCNMLGDLEGGSRVLQTLLRGRTSGKRHYSRSSLRD